MLKKIKIFLLDTLFPINCLSCGKENIWLCDSCLLKIPENLEQVCPVCERKITPDGRVCFGCRRKTALSGLLAASSYQNKLISEAVHYYKYRFMESLSGPLGKILVRSFLASGLPVPDLIFPVPLHRRRLRWRGFNQAGLLAKYLGRNMTPGFEIPVVNNLLIRERFTHPQMGIKNYFRRKKNIKNAFRIYPVKSAGDGPAERGFNSMKNKTVLLVDDIATTGATLFECAEALKKAGAKEVIGIVIARQDYKNK